MTSSSSNEATRKSVVVFAVHALVLALLIGYWPTLRGLYPDVLRAQVRAVYGWGDPPAVRVGPNASDGQESIMEGFEAGNEDPVWRVQFDTRTFGYWPAAILVALLLATPLRTRSRVLAVGLGVGVLGSFALLRIGLGAALGFAEVGRGARGDPDAWLFTLRTAQAVLNSNAVGIAAILITWIALARPRRTLDFSPVLPKLPSGGASRGGGTP